MIQLIVTTITKTELRIKARLDHKKYKKAIKIANLERKTVNLYPHKFHGELNDTILYNEHVVLFIFR